MNDKVSLIQPEQIEQVILLIRGHRVMLDRDLAALYGVTTSNLNKAVKRNLERFPDDFMFQLTLDEAQACAASRFQFGTLKRGLNIKYLPHVLTQEGVAMLSSVLRSSRAVQVNIAIMRVFVEESNMPNEFTHDVFLSRSAKDKLVVRAVAERLRKDGLKVWFDEWEIPSPAGAGEGGRRPGEGHGAKDIPAKIEAGLEHSRVLALCMSANAFGSDPGAPGLEAGTCGRSNDGSHNLRFRDPLDQERRFIPLRLDDTPSKAPWRNSFTSTGAWRSAST